MQTELIITDLTQMGGERVCIAGVDHKRKLIRPDIVWGVFHRHLYLENGIIRPRAVVKLKVEPRADCIPPHVEDCEWDTDSPTQLLRVANDGTWRMVLRKTAFPSVEAIFETELHEGKNIRPGTGVRSIGTIKAQSIDAFEYKLIRSPDGKRQAYRLDFTDAAGMLYTDISITDLTLRYYVHFLRRAPQFKDAAAHHLNEFILEKLQDAEVWMRIGLARKWNGWCWLQVNGIYTFPDYLEGHCFDDFRQSGVTLPDY
jgi:hypothetical protein